MFSTARTEAMNVSLWQVMPDRCERIPAPDTRSFLRSVAVYVPTLANLSRWAHAMRAAEWVRIGHLALPCPPTDAVERLQIAAVVISHRSVSFTIRGGVYAASSGRVITVSERVAVAGE